MSKVKSSRWVHAYFAVYVGGIAGLSYLTRTLLVESPAIYLPLAFPVILVAIAAFAARAEARLGSAGPQQSISLAGGTFLTTYRERQRATTVFAWTLINPILYWVYPRDAEGSRPDVVFFIGCVALGAFTGLVLPRLLRPSLVARENGE